MYDTYRISHCTYDLGRARADTNRGPIPGPRTKTKEYAVVYMICPNFVHIYTCIHVRVVELLTKILYNFWITECVSLYITLQIPMHLSGMYRLFLKYFGVFFFENSRT